MERENEPPSALASSVQFKPETIQAVIKSQWTPSSTVRMHKDAVTLAAYFAQVFTIEAIQRSVKEVQADAALAGMRATGPSSSAGRSEPRELTVKHLEKVLPQLLLDF